MLEDLQNTGYCPDTHVHAGYLSLCEQERALFKVVEELLDVTEESERRISGVYRGWRRWCYTIFRISMLLHHLSLNNHHLDYMQFHLLIKLVLLVDYSVFRPT